jgi:hypothetical protein
MNAPAFGEEDASLFKPRQPARETCLTFHRFRRYDLREAAREPAIVGFVPQRPIQTRRRHFKGVRVFQRPTQLVFHIQQRAQVVAHVLAVFDAHQLLIQPIHDHSKHPADGFPPELQIKQLQAMALRHATGGLANAFNGGVAGNAHNRSRTGHSGENRPKKTKKWARAHLLLPSRYNLTEYSTLRLACGSLRAGPEMSAPDLGPGTQDSGLGTLRT